MQAQHYQTITNWTDAYENGAYIDNASNFPPRWAQQAADFRQQMGERAALDIPYGKKPRQIFDLFQPANKVKGLLVFVHGGYWKAFDKSTWSHLAQGAVTQGWAVAIPSYTLAPEVPIANITKEIGAAIIHASQKIDGPIHLAGHSAGGHLVTRMLCSNGPLANHKTTQTRIKKVVSISGVHDLRPLLKTDMNDILQLDETDAATESPVLQQPNHHAELICLVGAKERPEFIRQSALLANIWGGLGLETQSIVADGKHHFDVIEALTSPEVALFL